MWTCILSVSFNNLLEVVISSLRLCLRSRLFWSFLCDKSFKFELSSVLEFYFEMAASTLFEIIYGAFSFFVWALTSYSEFSTFFKAWSYLYFLSSSSFMTEPELIGSIFKFFLLFDVIIAEFDYTGPISILTFKFFVLIFLFLSLSKLVLELYDWCKLFLYWSHCAGISCF